MGRVHALQVHATCADVPVVFTDEVLKHLQHLFQDGTLDQVHFGHGGGVATT